MSRVDKHKAMRFQGKHPPETAAARQRKCRAIKRGTFKYCQEVPCDDPPAPAGPNLFAPPPQKQTPALSAPTPSQQPALPAPPSARSTAIQKSLSSDSRSLALLDEGRGGESGDSPRLCLPPAVAARLRSLLDKHKAGKHLTAAERAEAEGLLDIAEYFVVQRMRRSLAA